MLRGLAPTSDHGVQWLCTALPQLTPPALPSLRAGRNSAARLPGGLTAPLRSPGERSPIPQQDRYYASRDPSAQLHFTEELDSNPGRGCSRELSSACLAAWSLWPGSSGPAHRAGTTAARPQLGTTGVSGLHPADIFCLRLCSYTQTTENTHFPLPFSTGPFSGP